MVNNLSTSPHLSRVCKETPRPQRLLVLLQVDICKVGEANNKRNRLLHLRVAGEDLLVEAEVEAGGEVVVGEAGDR